MISLEPDCQGLPMPTRTAVLTLAAVLGCCSFGVGQFLNLKNLVTRINIPLFNSLNVAFSGNQLIFNISRISTPKLDALHSARDAFLYGMGNRHCTGETCAPARGHWGRETEVTVLPTTLHSRTFKLSRRSPYRRNLSTRQFCSSLRHDTPSSSVTL